MKPASATDYRGLAKRRLPHFLFEYVDGAAGAEATLRRNLADLESVELRQRVLRDVSTIDLSTELFGQPAELPIVLGPVGLAGMYARRGECQAAKAAAARGVPFCLSTMSLCSVEEVANSSEQPIWFQLYMIKDREFMRAMLERASAQGCSALVFTVDLPMPGTRYRDIRSGFTGSAGYAGAARRFFQSCARPRWAWDVGVMGRPHRLGNVAPVLGADSGLEDFLGWIGGNFDRSATWDDIQFVRNVWKGPIILKGIMDPDDAKAAADIGVEGIVVSNHGGRQLDGAPSSASALPAIADQVGDKLTVLVDGGVRTGVDILKMLALGAKGVLLGRAWVYALAGNGEAGLAHLFHLLRDELQTAMSLTGCSNLSQVGADVLVKRVI